MRFSILFFLFTLIAFNACKEKKQAEVKVYTNKAEYKTAKPLDTKATCSCDQLTEYSWDCDLEYSTDNINDEDKKKQENIFIEKSQDSAYLRIKSIHFSGQGIIPSKFKVFKNVEHLIISGGDYLKPESITKLEIFPKLKSIEFWGSGIKIDTNAKWLAQIEYLKLSKSQISGLSSFKLMPKLKVLAASHSGFNPFPSDINTLGCLQQIIFEEYKFFDVDISSIDLSNFPCLTLAAFNEVHKKAPLGLDTSRNFIFEIRPFFLEKEEKERVEKYIQSMKAKKIAGK